MHGSLKFMFYGILMSLVCLATISGGTAMDSTHIEKIQPAAAQKPALPAALLNRLDSLRKADLLENWLNAWYDYFSPAPMTHIQALSIPFNQMWRPPKSNPEIVALFYLQIFAGYYQLQDGNILKSTDLYESAYRLTQNGSAIHDNELLDYLIKPLGNNYTRLGDYKRALFIQQEGLRRARKMKDTMQEAAALANLGTTARWNDLPIEAARYIRQGLKIVHPGTSLEGLLYSTFADILLSKGQIDSADLMITRSLSLFAKGRMTKGAMDSYWYAGALATAGTVAQHKKEYTKAIGLLEQALQRYNTYFPRARHRDKMKILVAMGQVYKDRGQSRQSITYFNRALEGLLPHRQTHLDEPGGLTWPADSTYYAENTLLDALEGKAQALQQLGRDTLALQGYQHASIVLQKLRTTIFSVEAKRLLQQQSLQMTEEAIHLAYQCYVQSDNQKFALIALTFAEEHKARLLLDDLQKNRAYTQMGMEDSLYIKQNRLRQAIAFYTHSYIDALHKETTAAPEHWQAKIAAAQYDLSLLDKEIQQQYPLRSWNNAITITPIMKALPGNMVAWEYFTGPKQCYGFAITANGIVEFKLLDNTGHLQDSVLGFVSHWFMQGPNHMSSHPAAYYQQAYRLYAMLQLVKPVESTQLLIIPDGVLGRLPFEALCTDSNYRPNPAHWPYLLLKAQTSQAYSLSVYAHLEAAFLAPPKNKGFAGFFISPDPSSGLATLNGVQQEADAIHKMIRGRFLINKAATANGLLEALQNSEVIHISTHGFLMGEQQIPALQMAGKKLLLADLYPLQAHPSLVVISACQTAGGLLSEGEGIISLAREFTAIGAGGVIASLWNINDETAARLTGLLYKNLEASKDKPAALYAAKKQWLNQDPENAALKLPYYWAGLLYYGNHIPLAHPLPGPGIFSIWIWLLISIVAIPIGVCLFYTVRKDKK